MSYSSMLVLKLMVAAVVFTWLAGCTPVPYRVCDHTNNCRNMTKSEALEAAEVSREWKENSGLKLGIARP
jgi:hypothetical protein